MKKNDFFEQTKKELNMTDKQYQEVINKIFSSISDSLIKGENVKIRGFGTFKITNYKARNGRNPKTGESIRIPAKRVIKLNVAKDLKTEVQKFES
ncbi:HU family DNA-binding protein [Spiroplasma platyhelix]|uniref:HU family DNA-binding protein n=1 Tax=Spiroplasma platyhelix PALS-1 TaxID=1276218 RepID=A0A846TSK3_9MOLU|nr:HU family DNA-binding protein [Spiroplasma platyhelix]MBE4704115.1 DNA-binding protein HU [Spiroplasma platyhelix PALS-1]NKE38485.1 HU family DNA-binding protein [Spiroplasma platyhelix PALS-1]UJB29373.1 DNA-binding protein HU-beta [Spiroplasma platyhelix PALS-1]